MLCKRTGMVVLLLGLMGCVDSGSEQASSNSPPDVSPTESVIVNPGFESPKPEAGARFDGWFTGQHAGPESYEFMIDEAVYHSGKQSMRIRNIGPEPYGLIDQPLPAEMLREKKVALSAWLKTEGTSGEGAGLTLRAMAGSVILAHNFMQENLVRGTQDWQRYTITLQIPEKTAKLEIGVMLQGKGTVWADDFEIALEP